MGIVIGSLYLKKKDRSFRATHPKTPLVDYLPNAQQGCFIPVQPLLGDNALPASSPHVPLVCLLNSHLSMLLTILQLGTPSLSLSFIRTCLHHISFSTSVFLCHLSICLLPFSISISFPLISIGVLPLLFLSQSLTSISFLLFPQPSTSMAQSSHRRGRCVEI